ncbi:MAG: cardiolipin synthase ClsB [Elusimicrobia bacterium]|nr:cardiolipin synthase ClsB [Elusimicrobiota bacterium]
MELRDWRSLLLPRAAGRAGYFAFPAETTRGNSLQLLNDGAEAYPAMLEAIRSARETVHFEAYLLRADRIGWTFADALMERARSGIAVRLIFDAIGSLDLPSSFVQKLRNAGVQLLEYHPVAPWRPRWAWGRRDHRKILVVDGSLGFTGGVNISEDYAPRSEGGGGWRDLHVRIVGPGAHELDRLFRQVWHSQTGRWFPLAGHPGRRHGHSLVQVAANQEFLRRQLIRRALIHAIRRARRRVVGAIAYFVPDRRVRRALFGAVKRGVKVDILVPGVSDVPAVAYASRFYYDTLLRHGVRLHAWPGTVLHAKAFSVDRLWASIGSYNITNRSLLSNLEVNLNVLDRAFAARLEDTILADIASSHEIKLETWRSRSYSDRVLERFFWLLKSWF